MVAFPRSLALFAPSGPRRFQTILPFGLQRFFISSKLHTVRVRQGEKRTFLGNAGEDGHHLGKERQQKTDMVLRQLRIRKEDRWKDLESYFFTTAHAHRPRKVSYIARGVPPSH